MVPDRSGALAPDVWHTVEADGSVRLSMAEPPGGNGTFITGIAIAPAGSSLQAGDVLCTLDLKTKVCDVHTCRYVESALQLRAPEPLRVTAINRELQEDPVLLQVDPRGAGWIVTAHILRP